MILLDHTVPTSNKSQLVSQMTTHLPMCLALLSGFPTVQERSREHSTCVIEPTRAWLKEASSKGCENEGMDAHLPRMLSHLSLSIPVFFCVCVCVSGESTLRLCLLASLSWDMYNLPTCGQCLLSYHLSPGFSQFWEFTMPYSQKVKTSGHQTAVPGLAVLS